MRYLQLSGEKVFKAFSMENKESQHLLLTAEGKDQD
jgi:hypothetical protein